MQFNKSYPRSCTLENTHTTQGWAHTYTSSFLASVRQLPGSYPGYLLQSRPFRCRTWSHPRWSSLNSMWIRVTVSQLIQRNIKITLVGTTVQSASHDKHLYPWQIGKNVSFSEAPPVPSQRSIQFQCRQWPSRRWRAFQGHKVNWLMGRGWFYPCSKHPQPCNSRYSLRIGSVPASTVRTKKSSARVPIIMVQKLSGVSTVSSLKGFVSGIMPFLTFSPVLEYDVHCGFENCQFSEYDLWCLRCLPRVLTLFPTVFPDANTAHDSLL